MNYNIIVIGGGPAGIISAITARKNYPDKKVLLIKNISAGVIPCGIPYMFTTLEQPEYNALGNAPLEKNNVSIKIDEVTSIDKQEKQISTKNNETFKYEKLILATGSNPIIPPIEGREKKGIYCVYKELGYLKKLKQAILNAKNIVIVGGGFIGVEFADELSTLKNTKISIIELKPEILSTFDSEFAQLAKQKLIDKGVNIVTDAGVVKFNGNEKVESVSLSDNKIIPADLVIFGIGASPNSILAKKAGIEVGKNKGILVDEYLRTSNSDIFAIGDCAEKKDFFTRKKVGIMLASTATSEARIAGANLFDLKLLRENKGTLAIYSTKISNLTLGSAGMTEKSALEEDLEILVGNSECVDTHPAKIPGSNKLKVKLIFSKQSGLLLGGQVAGGNSAGEIVNIIGLALQKNTLLADLETLQIATHPKLTASPTIYPLITAAQDALE